MWTWLIFGYVSFNESDLKKDKHLCSTPKKHPSQKVPKKAISPKILLVKSPGMSRRNRPQHHSANIK